MPFWFGCVLRRRLFWSVEECLLMVQLENIEAIEARLWRAADLLRSGSELASNEYFMPVSVVIFDLLKKAALTPKEVARIKEVASRCSPR
jgi:hypothetical protein